MLPSVVFSIVDISFNHFEHLKERKISVTVTLDFFCISVTNCKADFNAFTVVKLVVCLEECPDYQYMYHYHSYTLVLFLNILVFVFQKQVEP